MTRAKDISKITTDANFGGTLDVTGETTLSTHLNMGDNDIIKLGDSADLQIYHDGTHSYIDDTGAGNLILKGGADVIIQAASNNSDMIRANVQDSVQLFFDSATYGAAKLTTTATGIDVTGTVTADGLILDNAGGINSDVTNLSLTVAGGNADTSGGNITLYGSGSGAGSRIRFRSDSTERMRIESNGDISFYEDTGTTPKLFWDASAEFLGVGTVSPTHALTVQYNAGTTTAKFQNTNTSGTSIDSATLTLLSASRDAGISITSNSSRVSVVNFGDEINAARGRLIYDNADDSLEIQTAALQRINISNGGDISFYEDTGTTAKLFWDASNEYLGIQTASPSAPLHINGTSSLSTEFKVGNSTWNSSTGSGMLHQYRGSDGYSELQLNSTSTSGSNVLTIRDGSGISSSLYNDGSAYFGGNVGIGTQSPSTLLHLKGDNATILLEDSSPDDAREASLFVQSGDLFLRAGNNLGTGSPTVDSQLVLIDGGTMTYQANGQESFRVTGSNTHFSVGTTDDTYAFNVGGSGSDKRGKFQGSNQYRLGVQNGTNDIVWLGSGGANNFRISNSSGSTRFELDSAGRGTFTSTSDNTVSSGQGIVNVNLEQTRQNGKGPFIGFRVPNHATSTTNEDMGAIGFVATDSNTGSRKADFVVHTRNTTFSEKMRVAHDGKVGIGTTNPQNLLQVAAAIGLDNAVMASGTTSGDFDINISNQYTLNGSIWRQSGLLLFYNGVDTGLGNSTVLFTSIRLQGLSTWSSAVQSNIIGAASISDSNASSTGLTITVNVPDNNNGIVFVLVLGGNKPTVTIAG